jgi:hypothetical protein
VRAQMGWVGFFFGTIVFKHNLWAKQLKCGIKPEADIYNFPFNFP